MILGVCIGMILACVLMGAIPRALAVVIQIFAFLFQLSIAIGFAIACAILAYSLTH